MLAKNHNYYEVSVSPLGPMTDVADPVGVAELIERYNLWRTISESPFTLELCSDPHGCTVSSRLTSHPSLGCR